MDFRILKRKSSERNENYERIDIFHNSDIETFKKLLVETDDDTCGSGKEKLWYGTGTNCTYKLSDDNKLIIDIEISEKMLRHKFRLLEVGNE